MTTTMLNNHIFTQSSVLITLEGKFHKTIWFPFGSSFTETVINYQFTLVRVPGDHHSSLLLRKVIFKLRHIYKVALTEW